MKEILKRVAAKGRFTARRLVGAESTIPKGGVPVSDLLPILYPGVGDFALLESTARAVLGGRDGVETILDLRLILGSLDRQSFPTPVRVRLPIEQIEWHQEDSLRIPLDPQDGSVAPFIRNGDFEPHVTAALRRLCRQGWNVMDVGANVGYHTLQLASLVGPHGSVVAVEANPDNCLLIQRGLEVNALNNVRLLPIGLGREQGWSFFTTHVGTNGGLLSASAPESQRDSGTIVPLMRIDDLLRAEDRLDLIKIDVEGAEGLVIGGACEVITRNRPVVISEFSCEMLRRVSQIEPLDYLKFFGDLGYAINVIDRTAPGNFVPFGSAQELLDSWTSDLQIEDILFLPN